MGMLPKERVARYRAKRYAEIAQLPKIPCACGCDSLIPPINKQLKPAKYAHGHNPDGIPNRFPPGHKIEVPPEARKKAVKTRRERNGYSVSEDTKRKRAETRRARFNGNWTSGKRGWRHTSETIARMTAASKANALQGSQNPAWLGGISFFPYGPEFTRKFRRLIRERDGNKCQRCGKTAKQNREVKGGTMHIHHIDFDKANNDPSNLICLCHACHLWTNHHRDESLLIFPRRRMLLG